MFILVGVHIVMRKSGSKIYHWRHKSLLNYILTQSFLDLLTQYQLLNEAVYITKNCPLKQIKEISQVK